MFFDLDDYVCVDAKPITDEQMAYYLMKYKPSVLKPLVVRLPLYGDDQEMMKYIVENLDYLTRAPKPFQNGILPLSYAREDVIKFEMLAQTPFLIRYEPPYPAMHDYYFLSPLITIYDPKDPRKAEYLEEMENIKRVFNYRN